MALLDRFKKKIKSAKVSQRRPASGLGGSVSGGKEEIQSIKKPEEEKKERADQNEKLKKEKLQKVIGKKAPLAYRIIKEPHITEKANFLADQNKYVFKVFSKANKIEIKKIIEALYGVKVEKVHLIHSSPKKRRLGRSEGWRHGLKRGFKKAIITLAKGEKIELLPK